MQSTTFTLLNKRHTFSVNCVIRIKSPLTQDVSNVKKNIPYLCMLHKSSPKARSALLKQHCAPEFVKSICECVKNVLVGNVPLSSEHKKRLQRYKRSLRRLVLKKT